MPLYGEGEIQRVLFGLYKSRANSAFTDYCRESGSLNDADEAPEREAFRSSANPYDMKRVPCNATWLLNVTGLYLQEGSRDENTTLEVSKFRGDTLADRYPVPHDALPLARVFLQSMI